jgi:8-oxo-dGTP pyrophosphatase MutT (NUDIX family)
VGESGGSRRSGGRRRRRRARIERSSGGVVFRRNGEGLVFLLIRDPYDNWGLPKGHIEGDESPVDAAIREVAEETGLSDVAVVAELPTIDWYFRDRGRLVHKICHFYLIESAVGEPVPQQDEGITECIWRPFRSALELVTYDNARDVLRAAGEQLGKD